MANVLSVLGKATDDDMRKQVAIFEVVTVKNIMGTEGLKVAEKAAGVVNSVGRLLGAKNRLVKDLKPHSIEEQIEEKIEESNTIEKSKVLLNREWSFWENYETKGKEKVDYSQLLKEIYTFNDIISFWQFWNNYPGNDLKKIFFDGEYVTYFFKEKYRIIAMNVFQKGIRPEWEDKQNNKGNILTLGYNIKLDEIDDFLFKAEELWVKLICLLIGENLPFSSNINGIRFVDKNKIGFKNNNNIYIFKYEIWVNSKMEEKELEQLKDHCNSIFECQGTIKPIK